MHEFQLPGWPGARILIKGDVHIHACWPDPTQEPTKPIQPKTTPSACKPKKQRSIKILTELDQRILKALGPDVIEPRELAHKMALHFNSNFTLRLRLLHSSGYIGRAFNKVWSLNKDLPESKECEHPDTEDLVNETDRYLRQTEREPKSSPQ